MLTDPQNTLAYHNSRALTRPADMSAVPVSSVIPAYKQFHSQDKTPLASPEREALWFYGMNHGMALISAKRHPLEPLPAAELDFVQRYHAMMGEKARRSFYYLLSICVREARHSHSKQTDGPKLTEKFGAPVANFLTASGGEEDIINRLLKNTLDCSIGTLCDALRWSYYHSIWGGAYGGPKWGNIADCMGRFVNGEFTAEIMLDTIWTLSHNCAPIFNKPGKLFGHNGSYIVRLLDLQRSGQMIETILHDPEMAHYVNPEMTGMAAWVRDYFPGAIGPYVDWNTVEAKGSVQKYPNEIKKQTLIYGMTPETKAAIAAAKAKAEAFAAQVALDKKNFIKEHLLVMPGKAGPVYVKKIIRKEAA